MGALSGCIGLSALSALVGGLAAPAVPMPFVTRWNTANSGVSASNQIRIPLVAGETYDCVIDWGDGVTEPWTTSVSPTHTYAASGTYTVSISGTFPTIRFENGGDRLKLLAIVNWGTVPWTTFRSAFYGCANMQVEALDGGLANTAAVTDAYSMFRNCTGMTTFPELNLSSCTDLSYAWYNCNNMLTFTAPNISSAVILNFTWAFCSQLTAFPFVNTSNVTDFRYAWHNCTQLATFPFIDTSSGIQFDNTWENAPITNFPLIDMGNAVQCGSAWRGCRTPIFPAIDMSNIVAADFCFILMPLTTEILVTGLKATTSIFGCGLDAAALNDLYTRLDVVSGKTITVTNNPGVSGDDPTIATAKGWTVAGS